MKTKTAILSSMFCAGLLLSIVSLAQADTYITFQCDMTYQVQDGTFTNGVNTVYAIGSFNNWGPGVQLTNNPSGANTNLYIGTVDDTNDANGTHVEWKYNSSSPDLGWEVPANNGDNRAALLPTTSGASLVLPVEYFSDAAYNVNPVANNATFRVDMAQQIAIGAFDPNTMQVEVQGQFEGWTTGDTLTNDPSILRTNQFGVVTSNVYVGTFLLAGSPGQIQEFKYFIQPGNKAESPSSAYGLSDNYNNRFCFEGQDSTASSDQTLPIVFFSDQPYTAVGTNTYVFSVDMTSQVLNGALSNQQVTLQGDFNSWGTAYTTVCTNNPSASNTNIYYAAVSITNGVGVTTQFKFVVPGFPNGGYEYNPTHNYPGNPAIIAGANGNREFTDLASTGTNVILPTVYWNDLSPSSVLPAPTTVTFNVNMTGAVGTDAHVFNPSTDKVYLNGVDTTSSIGNYSFVTWTNAPTGTTWTNAIANFLMTENPVGSSNYTITLTIPAGYPVQLTYKYGINGNDDEAGYAVNHVRYIRSTGSYTLPTDIFGSMTTEQSFGNLAIGLKSGGNVPITWLGRPGVYLQVTTNLTSGTWMDLPATDAQSSTNYPAGAGASYFRLINPF